MVCTKRVGRPLKNNNKVEVNSLIVEYFGKKENGYNAEMCYMKTIGKESQKMKQITALGDEETRMPYWVTDTQEMLLKVKDKFIGVNWTIRARKTL